MIIGDALKRFYLRCRARKLSSNTIKTYGYLFSRFIRFSNNMGISNIEDITPDTIRQYMVDCDIAGYSDHTIGDIYRSLSVLFNWLEYEEYIIKNPMKKLQKPKIKKEHARTFKPSEVDAMLSYYNQDDFIGYRNYIILNIFIGTGIRKSELLNIRVNDLDHDVETLTVTGKGNKVRVIPIPRKLERLLRAYLRRRGEYLEYIGKYSDSLIITKQGRNMTASGLNTMFNALKEGVHIEGKRVSAHTFRHTFAVSWLNNGGGLAQLQDILGHDEINTTRIYISFTINDLRQQTAQYNPLQNNTWKL